VVVDALRNTSIYGALWHSFCFSMGAMNIEEINRKHFMETDMYYRVGYGLSSKIIGYSNGIFTLEIVLGHIIDARTFSYKQGLIHRGVKPGYDAKKGIIFRKGYLN